MVLRQSLTTAPSCPSTLKEAGRVRRLAVAEFQCDAAGRHSVGGSNIGHAEGEPGRRSRLIQVVEMTEAVPGFVRAGRPRSQGAFIP